MRVSGTFEWTNWSRFKNLTVTARDGATSIRCGLSRKRLPLPFNWSDGYFLAGGVEYDIYPTLTGRAGIAYEWSPVDSPEKRTPGFPDNNRVWLSGGFSWQFTPTTTIDFAYTHIFVEDWSFRAPNPRAPVSSLQARWRSKVDIVSVGVKTHW